MTLNSPRALHDVDLVPSASREGLPDSQVPGAPTAAHIVPRAGLTDAYVFGTPVQALCGFTFVPSRDPDGFALCTRCRDLNALLRPA